MFVVHTNRVPGRQFFGLIPPSEYLLSGAEDLAEDDEPFVMTEEARAEREDRWFRRLLSTDQQLAAIDTKFPLSLDESSQYGLCVLREFNIKRCKDPARDADCDDPNWREIADRDDRWYHQWMSSELQLQAMSTTTRGLDLTSPYDESFGPDQLDWRELNPRYLSEYGLWVATTHLLPACITDTRDHEHQTASPMQPAFGPFKCAPHSCKAAGGSCNKCGRKLMKSSRKTVGRPVEVSVLPHTKLLREPAWTGSTASASDLESSSSIDLERCRHGPDADRELDESSDTTMSDA